MRTFLIVTTLCAAICSSAWAAEPGDEVLGPFRGGYEDPSIGAVVIETFIWRNGKSGLVGLTWYPYFGCWKKLVQVPGPRIEGAGVQPSWFRERADPPDARCDQLGPLDTVVVGRGKDNARGFAPKTLIWTRVDRDGSIDADGDLIQVPPSAEMDAAVRAAVKSQGAVGAR